MLFLAGRRHAQEDRDREQQRKRERAAVEAKKQAEFREKEQALQRANTVPRGGNSITVRLADDCKLKEKTPESQDKNGNQKT